MRTTFNWTRVLAAAGLCLALTAGCGDDGTNASDTGQGDTSASDTDPGDSAAPGDTEPSDTSPADTTTGDTSPDDSNSGDAIAPPSCIDLDDSTVELPWAWTETFDGTTPTWSAPDDGCPATALRDPAVPHIAYQFCNLGTATGTFAIEMLPDSDDMGTMLVAYAGDAVPADPKQCGTSDEPLLGLAEVILIVAPGEIVTVVATVGAPNTGDFTMVAGPYVDDGE